jgi:mRNA-degrading endonuclease HigB of HigAB toxin-antitoxin module
LSRQCSPKNTALRPNLKKIRNLEKIISRKKILKSRVPKKFAKAELQQLSVASVERVSREQRDIKETVVFTTQVTNFNHNITKTSGDQTRLIHVCVAFLGEFAKLRKVTGNFVMSVRPSV